MWGEILYIELTKIICNLEPVIILWFKKKSDLYCKKMTHTTKPYICLWFVGFSKPISLNHACILNSILKSFIHNPKLQSASPVIFNYISMCNLHPNIQFQYLKYISFRVCYNGRWCVKRDSCRFKFYFGKLCSLM